jgi:hypothetical protein
MAETPMDIIKTHLGNKFAGIADTTDLAIDIFEELRSKFTITAKAAPAPRQWVDGDSTDITIRADNNPMLFYIGTDQTAVRLDDMTPGDRFPLRERQIALALIDLSANTLKDQTL